MEAFKSLLYKIVNVIKSLFNGKITRSIVFIIGLVLINKLHQKYKYNEKLFALTPNNTNTKAILITGCGSGIGEALAFKLNKLGFVVIATCRRNESVDKYLSNKSFLQNGSISYQLDISSDKNISSVKQKIKSFLKNNNLILWGIVNNAAILCFAPFEFQTHHKIKKQIDVNIYGTMNICHQFIPLIYGRCNNFKGYKSANYGRIVNISSVTAKFPMQGGITYAATKAAISHFSDGLRIELSPRFGIWCSSMELGSFKTNMSNKQRNIDEYNELMKYIEDRDDIIPFYNIKKENEVRRKLGEMGKDATNHNLDVAINDIIHSLTAKYPKRRYNPGVPSIMPVIVSLVNTFKRVERLVCVSAFGLENYS